jgi:acetylglutamate kinase
VKVKERIFLQHLIHRKLKIVHGATPEVNKRKQQVVDD